MVNMKRNNEFSHESCLVFAVVCHVPSCFSHVWLFVTPWTVAHQAPLSMGFSRQEYWRGLPCPPPEDRPNPGIEPVPPVLQVDALPLSHQRRPNQKINPFSSCNVSLVPTSDKVILCHLTIFKGPRRVFTEQAKRMILKFPLWTKLLALLDLWVVSKSPHLLYQKHPRGLLQCRFLDSKWN